MEGTYISDKSDSDIHIQYVLKPHTTLKHTWSGVQQYTFANTLSFDEALFIDGRLQSTQADEYIYHEMLVHSLLVSLPKRESVLILGGSEGCVTREVCKWSDVKRIVQVDWDDELVKTFKHEKAYWNNGAYNDPRLTVYTEDAMDFLRTCSDKFDAIIVDLLDPSEESFAFVKPLLREVVDHLNNEGGFIINAGAVLPYKKNDANMLAEFIKKSLVPCGFAIQIHVPSFIQPWCLIASVPNNSWRKQINTKCLDFETRTFTYESFIASTVWSKDYNGAFDCWPKIDDDTQSEICRSKMSVYNTYVLKLFPTTDSSREMYMKALGNQKMKSFPENDNAGFDLFVDSYGEKNEDGFLLAKLGVRAIMVNNFTKQNVHFWTAPRSSIWKNGVTLANSMGVIDRSYRGELMAALHVHSDKVLEKGIRLVQALAPDMGHIIEVRICDDSELDKTSRGDGGFGSTGK